ncbi:MAG TPA: helicase-related protein, partial [Gammaproteobacteria bacterium]|nr:helicase-related protein [Gammaproteobacteria bacterium]
GIAETLGEYNVGSIPYRYEDDEEFPDPEFEELEERLVDEASAAETAQEMEKEIELLRGLEEQARQVVQSQQDRKWETLREVLEENKYMRTPEGHRRKLIIFTEHRDTLNYLRNRIGTLIGNPEAVIAFHGGHSRDERRALQERFRNDPETVVLIATDAAGEGVNLQNAHLMINYDLPWNPNRIEQRFGRIHRIGQTEVCHLWNLVAKETREGAVFERLFEKLDAEREALGGRVFDILGTALAGQSLRDVLIEAIRYGNDPDVRRKNLEKVEGALDRQKLEQILRDNALCEQAMTPEVLFQIKEEMEKAEARKLQPLFVQAFFGEAFRRLNGEMRPRESGRFEIRHVPADIRERDKRIGSPRQPVTPAYERICFDKSNVRVSGKPPASLIHPGHPLMRAVTNITLDKMRPLLARGAMLLNPADEGMEPYLLALIDHSIRESGASQKEAALVSRRLHFCAVYPDGRVRSGGYAPHLDLQSLDSSDSSRLAHLLNEDWLAHDLEARVLDYARNTLVPQHYKEVNQRRQRIVTKTLDAVRNRLITEINRLGDRFMDMQEKVRSGRQPAVQLENLRRRRDDLAARLHAREAELEASAHLEAATPVLLGAALVIPQGLVNAAEGEPPATADGAARKRIEQLAMQAVMDYERSLGHAVKDVSADNCGWDVTAQPPADSDGRLPPARHIEVKGRRADATTVTVSRNEIAQALNQGDKFWLAIALVDGDEVDGPHYIRQPFTQPPDWAETSKALDLAKLLARAKAPAMIP